MNYKVKVTREYNDNIEIIELETDDKSLVQDLILPSAAEEIRTADCYIEELLNPSENKVLLKFKYPWHDTNETKIWFNHGE